MNNAWAANGSPEMGEKKIEREKWRRGGGAEGKSGVREERRREYKSQERVSLQPIELLWVPGQEASWSKEAVNWLAAELAESSPREAEGSKALAEWIKAEAGLQRHCKALGRYRF